MPTYEARGTRIRGTSWRCDACDAYAPRPDGGPWGGECTREGSDALYWDKGGFRFTAPNDTCRLWTGATAKKPVQDLSGDDTVKPKLFHGEQTQDSDF